jgi:hypothetical protein
VLAGVRILFLAGIVVTGIFRVVKNLPDIVFSPGFTMFIDIAHLCFMPLYILTALAALLFGKRWLRERGSLA